MDAPPPYPGAGGFQAPPPPYSVTDPSAPYPTKEQGFQVQGQGYPGQPHQAQAQGQIMVVCGGWDGDRALESVEMFSPRTGQWSALPSMMVPRRDHGAAVLGEFLYVVGGWNMDPYYSSTERFHIPTQTWSPGPSLSSARGWPGLAQLGEFLYCVGGYDARDRAVSTVERLHIGGDRWEHVADMNKVRGGCGVVAYHNRLYAIGGYDGKKKKKSVEVYDPEENRWRPAGEMPQPREDLSHSCVLFNDHIVVAGGLGEGDQVLSNCQVFNPNNESWTPLQSSLIREKRGMSLCVLDGVMHGAGGEDRNDQNLEMLMIYDNSRQVWTQGPNMRVGRAGHGAVVFSV